MMMMCNTQNVQTTEPSESYGQKCDVNFQKSGVKEEGGPFCLGVLVKVTKVYCEIF